MFNSQMTTTDLSRSFSFKHEEDLELKSREAMDSDLHRHHQLTRLRSAPSSLLTDYMDEGSKDYFPRSSSPETDIIFERFISTSASADPRDLGDKPLARGRSWQFLEADVVSQQNGFQNTPSSQMMYSSPASIPNHSSGIENSYRGVNSVGMDSGEVRSGGNCSNLIRHSSSPAGLLSNVMEGYRVMRGMPNYRAGNGPSGEVPASTSRFKNQMNISSRETSSPALMSQLSEMVSDGLGHSSSDDGSLGNSCNGSRCYIPGFPISSWDDTPLVSSNFSGLKRDRDHINGRLVSSLNPPDAQSGEAGNHPSGLAHQFSLPKTSSEMAAVENFLHLHESVPCKVRAKRGCATHPRSIAERIRRTKISERTRKLQELVPNMDKQTNTADMLDLAVDYIKDLQKQVKVLSESRARCSCSSKQKPYPNPAV